LELIVFDLAVSWLLLQPPPASRRTKNAAAMSGDGSATFAVIILSMAIVLW
jgi:hypothetical protein